jgi:hypothetical protein
MHWRAPGKCALLVAVQPGTCKLCLKSAMLQDSHYIPRGMYKRIRDAGRKNPNPIRISRTLTSRTSRQCTDYVLCSDCEQRLNRGGETWMMNGVAHGKRFRLRDRLDVALPKHVLSEATVYSGTAIGIDTNKLGYFALSLVWRGGIHEWPLPFGERSVRLALGPMEESIRKYLLGEDPFPPDAAVVVHVCDDQVSQESILEPCQRVDQGPSFEILTLGGSLLCISCRDNHPNCPQILLRQFEREADFPERLPAKGY